MPKKTYPKPTPKPKRDDEGRFVKSVKIGKGKRK